MAAKQLTFTKVPLNRGVDDPDQNAGLWLGKGDDGEVVIKIRLPGTYQDWSEPMTPDKAFRILDSWEEAGNVCVIDKDDLWPATWPALGSAVKA